MDQIIANLLVADSAVIKKATDDLKEAYKHPETVPNLCNLVVSANDVQIRQYSAVLLRKRFNKRCNWDMVPPEQQQIIKQGMLNALIQEKERAVRNAVVQFVGALVRHESDKKDPWMSEVLQFIFQHCSSSDPNQNELGASIFASLTDSAPDQFVPHMEAICGMFSHVLVQAEATGNLANPVLYNILLGMGYLVPYILGHNNAEHIYQKSIPFVIQSLKAFAIQDADKFIKAFDILENLADYTPKLLSINIQPLLEFCLELANNVQVDSAVRVKSVEYIGWLVRLKKKIIVKQKLVDPIIQVIFNLMATETNDDDDENEEYFLGSDTSNPMTTATQTMDLLALHVPPEKLIPPLLRLLEPALRGPHPLPKKASYLCIAVIAEGCSEAICAKYLATLLDVVKMGITEPNPVVRNAAFFALGQFSEHLQPDITKFAPEILPILFQFLQELCNEIKNGAVEPKHIDRMFYALETFCENLEDAIVPHLSTLMERLIEALDTKNSVRLRELSLSAVSSAATAAKSNMLPYFSHLIEILKPYLVKSEDENVIALQPQAIDTLASLARTIGKENFMPLANDTMAFALELLTQADDPDLRRAIYNLIGSMSDVANEEMGAIFPQIMERLYESILSTDEVIPEFRENNASGTLRDNAAGDMNNSNEEIDIQQSDDEDDDDNIAGYTVENAYVDEKEEAILTLKEFAEHTGAAFIPYLQKSYENIYKMIDHPQEDIRKVSIDALCIFIVALFKQNDIQGGSTALSLLIPKLGEIVKNDEECTVAMAALEGFGQLLKELKSAAIPNEQMRNIIFTSLNDVMNRHVASQFDEPNNDDEQEESEYDEALVESAGNVLPLFGHAMLPSEFAMYFGRVLPILVKKIEKTKGKEEFDSQRSFAYGALSECFAPLQNYTSAYFDDLLPILLAGQNDGCEQVRQNSVYGIGEMVLYAENKSYKSYPQILTALSHAVSNEKHQGTLDNIIGSISRLILTNSSLIPLEQVLPVYIEHLPLKEDFDENSSVFKCLQSLYIQGKTEILPFIEKILLISIHVLCKQQYKNQETYENILAFTREIRDKFPDKYMAVVNSNTEIANFVQNL